WGAPASMMGSGVIVITTLSLTGAQGPDVVIVNVTEPFVLSLGPGVYCAFGREASSNTPSPEVVQVIPVDPVKSTASCAPLLSHMVCTGPASAVAPVLTVITTSSVAASQSPPGSSVVNRSVYVPSTVAVNVTDDGVPVCDTSLSAPSPPLGWLTMLHAPVVADPPIDEPTSVAVPPPQIICGLPA